MDTTGAKLSNDSQKIRSALYKSRLWRSPCDNLKGICYNENNDTKEEGLSMAVPRTLEELNQHPVFSYFLWLCVNSPCYFKEKALEQRNLHVGQTTREMDELAGYPS